MCGIAGIMEFGGQAALRRVVAMTDVMRSRGPDDEGFVVVRNGQAESFFGPDSPHGVREILGAMGRDAVNTEATGSVVLGHRRLSIVDLSAHGHQPMADAVHGCWIVFNGEIYNFRDLRSQLSAAGHRFRSGTDTEVVLAAYATWGAGCLDKFNGDFAFAIWDPRDQSLFCARDRVGVKPFHYALSKERFVFGSSIKAVLSSGLQAASPDPDGLYLSLMFGMAPRPLTAFQGIRGLEPAHWMRVHRDGRVDKARYWSIPVGAQDHHMSMDDAAQELHRALSTAVSRRLEADVPVGTFMSGGVDSTTISAMAAKRQQGIKAFTLGFADSAPELDEVLEAQSTACMWPIRHIIERISRESLPCDLSTWIDGYEEPYYSLAANHVVSSVARRNGIKVVLNGLGGDELFGGYSYYRLPGWFGRLPRAVQLAGGMLSSTVDSHRLKLALAASPDRVHTLAFARWSDHDLRRMLRPEWHMAARIEDVVHDLYARDLAFTDNVEAFCYMDVRNYLGNHHVHRVDQFTMAVSVEGRFPFLDHEVVELAFRIPSRLKVGNGQQKWVLRQAAAGLISPECLRMKKKGFGLPLAAYLQGPLAGVARESVARLRERGILSDAALEALRCGKLGPERHWQLVMLDLWMERFIDRAWYAASEGGRD